MDNRQRLFVYGSMRCGKTPYVHMLNACDGVLILNEDHSHMRWLEQHKNLGDMLELEAHLFSAKYQLFGDRYAFGKAGRAGGPEALQATGLEFKIIYVIRDPRDTIPYDSDNVYRITCFNSWYKATKDWLSIQDDFDQLTIRFEDLIECPKEVISKLAVFCNLSVAELTAAYDNVFDIDKANVPLQKVECPNAGAQALMRSFGYE